MKRRKQKYQKYIDKRLDWRDPDMPVFFHGKVNGVDGIHKIPSNEIHEYYKAKMKRNTYDDIARNRFEPDNWRNDPSYHWATKLRT